MKKNPLPSAPSSFPQSSILNPVPYHPSPNCDNRPDNTMVDLLVIHGISLPPKQFGGGAVEQFFMNQLDYSTHPFYATLVGMQVSAHLFIRRTGETIQYVPFNKRAWHAGKSHFEGREHCNDFSIGIELEGTDDIPYTMPQYEELAKITRLLMQSYPAITRDRIVGHSDIAPGRKTDPGPAFDWELYFGLL